jgi:hypothetical protein
MPYGYHDPAGYSHSVWLVGILLTDVTPGGFIPFAAPGTGVFNSNGQGW